MHFSVGHIHFTIGSIDLVTPILVFEDELPVIKASMIQLSIKEGLKRFRVRHKKGALKEMK